MQIFYTFYVVVFKNHKTEQKLNKKKQQHCKDYK